MKITLNTQSGVFPITLKGDGVAERTEKTYIKLTLFFQNYEILSLGQDEVYIKYLGTNTWERTRVEQMDLPTSLLRNAFSLLEVSEIAIDPMLSARPMAHAALIVPATSDSAGDNLYNTQA